MKIIGDAFAGESKIDDDMANRREKYALSPGKSVTAQRRSVISKPPEPPCRINSVCPQTARNKRSGTTGKGVETGFSGSDVRLTKEEEEQIAKIKAAGLTEYQQQSLALKNQKNPMSTNLPTPGMRFRQKMP